MANFKNNFKKFLMITVGVAGSGKTTFANELINALRSKGVYAVNVNRDDIRLTEFSLYRLSDYKFSKSKEDHVTEVQMSRIRRELECGNSVIVSDTNLDPNRWDKFKKLAEEFGVEFMTRYFPTPLYELLKRNIARDASVPEFVIRKQLKAFETNFPDEIDYWKPVPYVRPECAIGAYIFDIDGTLAHMDDIRGPFDWDKVDLDRVDDFVASLARLLYSRGHRIIIMSGRMDCCREKTEQWLRKYGIEYHALLMRQDGDHRPDTIVKDELFEQNNLGKFDILGVFDDRNCVVDMWRDKGLKVFQCELGQF